MRYLYHGSEIGRLTEIQPKHSLHGCAYVYAVLNQFDALWYCSSRFREFELLLNEQGILDLNKLESIYKEQIGYIYYLDREKFIFNDSIGHWVSKTPVLVENVIEIPDIYKDMIRFNVIENFKLEKVGKQL